MKCTPAKHDHRRVRRRPPSRESPSESPTNVGDVLHLGALVVVREDDGVALAREVADLGLDGASHVARAASAI